jgi:hypothetical protein
MRGNKLTSVPKWFLAVSPRTFFPTIDISTFDMFGIDHGFLRWVLKGCRSRRSPRRMFEEIEGYRARVTKIDYAYSL